MGACAEVGQRQQYKGDDEADHHEREAKHLCIDRRLLGFFSIFEPRIHDHCWSLYAGA